jgi:hypothetical protein
MFRDTLSKFSSLDLPFVKSVNMASTSAVHLVCKQAAPFNVAAETMPGILISNVNAVQLMR